jgi:hypothetical protein
VVRPHQVFGAETAFAETARFIKVSAMPRGVSSVLANPAISNFDWGASITLAR